MRAALLLTLLPGALSLPSLLPTPEPTAAPAPALAPRAAPTAIWVAVDKDGTPTTTVTPRQTTVSGTPTLVDAPPYAVTGTVFTWLDHLIKTTSTGSRKPAPTGKGKSGAFARCFADGRESPFCEPVAEGKLFVGKTYYVTWDPKFFAAERKNAIGPVRVTLESHRVDDSSPDLGDKSWETRDPVPSKHGVYAWKVPGSALRQKGPTNVTLVLRTSYWESDDDEAEEQSTEYAGPTILLTHAPAFKSKGTQAPRGAELYIALPAVGALVVVMIFGTCVWNRRLRRIGLGNVMSRTRHRLGKRRRNKLSRSVRKTAGDDEVAVMLEDWDGRESGEFGSGEGGESVGFREEMARQEREFEARRY